MGNDLEALSMLSVSAGAGRVKARSPREVAQEFESLFLQQLLQLMRPKSEEAEEDGLFGGSDDAYLGMVDQALAQALAKRGGIGLAAPIEEYLEAVREKTGSRSSGRESAGAADCLAPSEVGRRLGRELRGNRVTSEVGWRNDPFTGEARFHRGTDLALPAGTPVRTVVSGKVVFAGEQAGYGKTVVVEGPNGGRVRYAHLGEIGVREGEIVAKGDKLGTVGSSGRSTGPHLHLEMEVAGRVIRPEE
ncbi:MAG: hypothetical protein Kow00109_11660 [Acidobacteriota bacterium]